MVSHLFLSDDWGRSDQYLFIGRFDSGVTKENSGMNEQVHDFLKYLLPQYERTRQFSHL